ncbi:BTB and MATH domain-containing protein 36-like [Crassostrea virginica]
MASEKKIRKLEEGTPMTIPQEDQQPRPLFPKTDAILEVEGREIHINKQILADSSPVFKKMFESDFKEKHMHKIPLPGKKYEDFEKFVFLIYYPGDQCQITIDTVPVILSLSVEYQVTALQDRCETFLTKTLEHVQNYESDRLDIPTLLRYRECSTKYNLPNISEQAVNLLARYDVKLLKQAGVSGEL